MSANDRILDIAYSNICSLSYSSHVKQIFAGILKPKALKISKNYQKFGVFYYTQSNMYDGAFLGK